MSELKELENQIKKLDEQYTSSKNHTDSIKESLDKLRIKQHELQQKQSEDNRNKIELGYFSKYVGKYIKLSLAYSIETDEELKEGYLYYKLDNAKLEPFNPNDKSVYLYISKVLLFEYNKDGSFNTQISNKNFKCHFNSILCGRILFEYPKYMEPHIKEVSCALSVDVAEKEIKELLEKCLKECYNENSVTNFRRKITERKCVD